MQRNSTCSSAGDCFFFGIPTEGHVQSAIDPEYFWLWLLQPCCNPCVCFQDEQGTIFDDIDTGSVVNGDASNGSAPNPAVAAPIPPLWCRWIVYLLCLAAVSPHVLTIVWLTCLRKGPIDRVAFPAANATVSPFQQLGQYIMILGQKIDSAQELKDTLHKSCLYHCLFICVSWFFCFFFGQEKLDKYAPTHGKAKELLGTVGMHDVRHICFSCPCNCDIQACRWHGNSAAQVADCLHTDGQHAGWSHGRGTHKAMSLNSYCMTLFSGYISIQVFVFQLFAQMCDQGEDGCLVQTLCHLHKGRHNDECLACASKVWPLLINVCQNCFLKSCSSCAFDSANAVWFLPLGHPCRKWKAPETDEQKEAKRKRAEQAKESKRQKKAEQVKEENWSMWLGLMDQVHIACQLFGSISRTWQAVIFRILGLLRTWLALILWGSMNVTMGVVDLKLCFSTQLLT